MTLSTSPLRVRRIASRVAFVALVSAALGAAGATPSAALRHLKFLRSSPMGDSTVVKSPDAIRLWLSEPVELPTAKIELATDVGVPVALAKITRDTTKNAPLVSVIPTPLANGAYKVTWKAMSKDGHVVNGVIPFKVAAGK
ncbi:MAG: copper resistance protein CopC [Gemmatimonas sp.]